MATAADPTFTPPNDGTQWTLNEYGYWVDPQGDLAPNQNTPGAQGLAWDPATGQYVGANTGTSYVGMPGNATDWTYDPATGQIVSPYGSPSSFGTPAPTATTTPTPAPTGGTGATGGTGTAGTAGAGGPFDYNAPAPPSGSPNYIPPTPQFTPPDFKAPPAFKAPSIEDALNDPAYAGYQFQLGQGEQGLQNWAAARGTLNDSGTAQSLINYGQNAGRGYYQQLYQNALGDYMTNYKTQYTDPYNAAFQGAQAAFAPQMTAYSTQAAAGQYQANASYQDAYQTWLAKNGFMQQWLGDQLAANAGTRVSVGA